MQIFILKNRLLFSGKVKDIAAYLNTIKVSKQSLQKFINQNLQ